MSDVGSGESSRMDGRADARATAFILVTILVDTIGFGIIVPVIPRLIVELTGEDLGGAALYGGGLLFVYALMQFFFAPVLGNLSDRFGRRPVLLGSLAAFGLDYLLMGLAPTITWLFVGRMLAGVFGATHATANAYVADISPPEERAKRFGWIGATWGIGFTVGPVIGGLLGDLGPRFPFFVAAALALLNVVYGIFVLRESLPLADRRPFHVARANPVGAIVAMRPYPIVLGLFVPMALYQIAHDANPSVWNFYTMLKLGWSEREVGLSLGAVGIAMAVVQAGLIGTLVRRFGDKGAVTFGYAMMAISYFGFAYASVSWAMVVFVVPFALGTIVTPAIRGILTNQVPANAQGELQGAISSLVSVCMIGAPLLMTQVFGYFTSDAAFIYFPGAPYFLAGALVVFAMMAFARVMANAGALARETG